MLGNIGHPIYVNTLCLGRLQITPQAHMDSNLPVDSRRPAYRSRLMQIVFITATLI